MKISTHALVAPICLFISCFAVAHNVGGGGFHGGAHPGGGYHNPGNNYNNGGYHNHPYNNGYHNGYDHGYNNNVWYGGGVSTGDDDILYDDGLSDDSTNVVIGVPDNGYYDPSCQTVQSCNPDGECITQQNCD